MYLDAVLLNHNRKERLCKQCKEFIRPGSVNVMAMRRGRKGGRYYVYTHPICFLVTLWKENDRKRKSGPHLPPGRPPGSELKAFAANNPEQAKERHKLIRARARLMRLLVVEEDDDRICDLVARILGLRGRIEELLEFQVESEKVGHRHKESTRILDAKLARARAITRSKERAAYTPEQEPSAVEAQPDPSRQTIEEIDQNVKESLERAEKYQESGQVWKENSRD